MNSWGRVGFTALLLAASIAVGSSGAAWASKPSYTEKMNMGNLLFFNGDIDRAIKAFEAAAELNTHAFEPHLNLINLYIQKGGDGAIDHAIHECDEVIARKPSNRDVHLILGNLLRNQAGTLSDPEKAKATLEHAANEVAEAEKLGSKKSLCEYTIGMILLQKGDTDQALPHLDEALKEQPDFADAHMVHAVLKFKQVTKPDTTDPDAKPKDINSPALQSAIKEVLDELDVAIKQKGKNAEAHNTKAEILLALGKTDEALAEYHKATTDEPRYLQAWVGIGTCEAQLAMKDTQADKQKEHIQAAKDAFIQAKKLKPDDKNVVYALAVMFEKLGMYQQAANEFAEDLMLETDPLTKANITMHVQQLQQAGMAQLDTSSLGGVGNAPGVGNSLFTSGALSMPFKDLIQIKGDKK